MAAGLIHVVRHAHAGDREAWTADDDLRPLSPRGCAQAERLADVLTARPAAIYSSPSVRCMATVLPLAQRHRLPVCTLAELYEGGSAATMVQRLAAEPRFPVVASTHGDLLVGLLEMLVDTGLTLLARRIEKGSTWTLEVSDGVISSARYAPPP